MHSMQPPLLPPYDMLSTSAETETTAYFFVISTFLQSHKLFFCLVAELHTVDDRPTLIFVQSKFTIEVKQSAFYLDSYDTT